MDAILMLSSSGHELFLPPFDLFSPSLLPISPVVLLCSLHPLRSLILVSPVICMQGGGVGGGLSYPGGLLVSSGSDRSLVFTEPRKWHTVHKWQAPVKYDVHHVAFSHVNPRCGIKPV